jgi:hypothetical protein
MDSNYNSKFVYIYRHFVALCCRKKKPSIVAVLKNFSGQPLFFCVFAVNKKKKKKSSPVKIGTMVTTKMGTVKYNIKIIPEKGLEKFTCENRHNGDHEDGTPGVRPAGLSRLCGAGG